MDFYKNLPLAARIALPAVIALVIAFLVYSMMLKPAPPVEIIKTQDVGVVETAKKVLDSQAIDYDETQDKGNFMLSVADGEQTKAANALAQSGIKDRTGLAKKKTCPAPPGFTATRAANERADNCADALRVQGMLLAAGAIAANVEVSQQSNETLLGPEKSKNVVAQVFLPAYMKDGWKADEAARALSRSVGTTLDRVIITDDQLQALFDGSSTGSKGPSGGSASAGSSSMTLGCGDIAGATEVATKQTAVKNCKEGQISAELTKLLGGSDRYVLSVEPTIDSVSRQTNSTKNSAGPSTSRSTQKGDGTSVEDVETPANTSTTTSIDPAGDISLLRINVILDKNVVTADQLAAVKTLLSSYTDTRRGDPVPTVKLSAFANGAGEKPKAADLTKLRDDAKQGATGGGSNLPRVERTTEMPKWAMALMAVLVIGVVVMIAILLRRSSAIAAERARLEQSFKNEQRLFEDFARQRPDELAADLNALFGAPSPSHHA